MTVVCEECGREFNREEYRDVHPCPEQLGIVKARAIRSMCNPAQYRLDEFDTASIESEEPDQ